MTDPGLAHLRGLADLEALGARSLLEHSRGDGHVIAPEDIRLFDTGL